MNLNKGQVKTHTFITPKKKKKRKDILEDGWKYMDILKNRKMVWKWLTI